MQFSPPSGHSIQLWSKYSPRHPVLKHPQSMLPSAYVLGNPTAYRNLLY
jgi:hypothetical protein